MTSNVGFFNGRLGIAKSDPNVAVYINTQDAIKLPAGFTSQRPAGLNVEPGMMRYNTTTGKFEGYSGETGTEAWGSLGDGSGGGGGGGGTSSEATGDTTLQGQTLDSVDPNMSGLMTNQSTVVGGGDFEVMGSGTHANLDIIAPAGSANLNLKVGTAASTAATIGWNDTVIDFNKQVKINGNLTLTGNLLESDGVTPRIFSNWTVHSNGNDIYRSSGNVGIGTTTPAYPLHVNGTIGIGVRTDYGAPILQHTSYVSEDYFSIGFSDGTSSGTQNAGKALNVLRKGNVGIGTTDPGTYKLNVNGKGYFSQIDIPGGDIQGQINTKQNNLTTNARLNANCIGANSNVSNTEYGYLDGVTSAIQTQLNAKQATITFNAPSSNNSNPSTSAQIKGALDAKLDSTSRASSSSQVFVTHGSGENLWYRVCSTSSTGNGDSYIYGDSDFVFNPLTGYVGIKESSPDSPLHVGGTIQVDGRGYFASGWTGGASRPFNFTGYGSVNIHTGAYSSNDFLYDGGSTASVWASGDQAPGSASDSTSYFTMDVEYGICIQWGGVWTDSDRRIKRDIEDAPDNLSLEYLRNIPIRYYNYRDPDLQSENKVIGFIAQEVEEIYPDAVWEREEIIPDELRNIEIGNNAFWETDSSDNLILYVSDLSGAIPGKKVRFWVKDSRNEYKTELNIEAMEDGKRFKFEKKWEKLFIYGKTCLDRKGICKEKLFAISFSACQELDKQQQADKAEIAELKTKVTTLESTLETVLARLTELENTPTDEVVV